MKRVLMILVAIASFVGCQAQFKTQSPKTDNSGISGQNQQTLPAQNPSTLTGQSAAHPVPHEIVRSKAPSNVKTVAGPIKTQPIKRDKIITQERQKNSVKSTSVANINGGCFCKDETIAARAPINKIDILFVTDTSHSLFKEREEVAYGIDHLLAQLPKDIDYRVGLMPAHGSTSPLAGRLFAPNNEPKVLSSSPMNGQAAMSPAAIRSALRDRFVHVPSDARESDRGEEGLYSLTKALYYPNIKESIDAGFFRRDAALVVIFFSDENDICAVYPAGISPKKDPQGMEDKARARDCKNVSPQAVFNRLKVVKKEIPFTVNGILYTEKSNINNQDRSDAYSGENEIGYGYLDLIRLTNGVEIPLGDGPISERIGQIGEKMNSQIDSGI